MITFKEVLQRLLILINKKRLLLPMPFFIASFTAKIFQLLPKPLITEDQLRLLKYDNILSGKYKLILILAFLVRDILMMR